MAQGQEPLSAYVRAHRFEIGAPIHFDELYPHVTALEYALSAIGADLVGTLQALARRRRIVLDNVEAVVSGELNNPLTFLDVVGEEGHPGLELVRTTVYVSSAAAEEELQALWNDAIQKSPLVRTFKDSVALDLILKITL